METNSYNFSFSDDYKVTITMPYNDFTVLWTLAMNAIKNNDIKEDMNLTVKEAYRKLRMLNRMIKEHDKSVFEYKKRKRKQLDEAE